MNNRPKLPSFPGSNIVYIGLACLTLLETITTIAQAVFLARAITFLFQGETITAVLSDICYFIIVFVLRHLFSLIKDKWIESFAEKIGNEKRQVLVETYFKQGRSFTQNFGTGRLVTLAIEGIDQFKQYVIIAVPRMIRTLIIPTLLVIYIFTIDKVSAVILVVTVPIIVVFMILLGMAAQKMANSQYETYRILSNHFVDSLKGLESLTYLGRSKQHEKKIDKVSDQYRRATNRTLRVAFLSSFALDFFTSLSIAFVAVGLGFRLIDGHIDLLPALTILILAPEYFLPIRQLGKDFHATLDGQVAMEEIEKIIIENHNDPIDPVQIHWNSNRTLQIENISVHIDEQTLLQNITFSTTGNRIIGIVGPSGAGKSTLIHVLAGFLHPNQGTMKIHTDDKNVITLASLKNESWLENIGYIPQHPYIFPTSLANNIRFYMPDATDDIVNDVVKKIGLTDFVASLPNGIHEPIGEGGRTLSGGQEQRIAMARVLLSNKPILLLDEPTAHLDIETEYEIKQVMLEIFKDKLVFLATHRTHWMKDMDHILMLDHGHVAAQGTHHDLMAKKGVYYKFILNEHVERM
ncbi:thiol reductant ABC exporter subunit CydD [Virgibacillus soli]|uniref:thiol reductant ABC exporter subunit CydD n=1 Tax=Paracerasibacillus soli TaxID=480284 RepID=UPI0035EA25EE